MSDGRSIPTKNLIKFGYLNWEELKNAALMVHQGHLIEFQRAPKVQRLYEQHKKHLNENKISIEEYILQDVFGHIHAINQTLNDPNTKEAVPYVLGLNHFPYNVEAKHFILWGHPNLVNEQDLKQEMTQLSQYLKRDFDLQVIWFINPIETRSVPQIPHAHLFVRDPSNV